MLRALGGVGAAGIAGCNGLLRRQSSRNPPVVENRPDAVYLPSHVEGMEMIGMAAGDDRMIGLMYSFAHRFWTVTGTETNRVSPDGDVHLMVSVWDPDSGTVLPVGSDLSLSITRDGEPVDGNNPWTMLSQNMGFHFGDNYYLEGDGIYEVLVEVGGLSEAGVGDFEGRFAETVEASFEWDYSAADRDEIAFQTLDDAGDPGAVDPMEMTMPLSVAPAPEDLPGRVLGDERAGDVTFVATVRSADDGGYLAVSPRTRYNGYVLPAMSVSATLERDGTAVFDDALRAAVDPDLGYHYGATVDGVESGDELTVAVDAPPQVSRHEGYETAFTAVPDASITVD